MADSPAAPAAAAARLDLTRPWRLNPQVSLRPEPFGALAYHFGTRRLSFLKSRTLLAVVQQLEQERSGADACRAAGVPEHEMERYEQALATLAESGMICEQEAA
jgi:putative mycofactocin binding protein MftB